MAAGVVVLSPDTMLLNLISADRLTVVFWRGILSSLTLFTALFVRDGRRGVLTIRQSGWPGLAATLLFAGSTISFVHSVNLTSAANTLVIVAASPLFAAVFTGLFLKEPVPVRTWLAAGGGAGAVMVIFGAAGVAHSLPGDLLAVFTAMAMAANFVIVRKFRQVSMIPAVAASGLVAALAVAPLCRTLAVTVPDGMLLIVMGTVVLPVPLAVMTVAPTLIPAAEVSLILLLETFLGPALVFLAVGQVPTLRTVTGGLLLVAVVTVHSMAGPVSGPGEQLQG